MRKKIKIGLLGGAFNPVTKGHIDVAKYILNKKITQQVWLMPAYEHMYGKSMVSPDKRVEMCKLAAQVDGRIKVSDYEIVNCLSGETYNLVKRLQNEDWAKHKFDFSFIIGQDNANNFDKWVNYEYLEKMIRFVVIPRKGIEMKPGVNWFLKPPHIFLNDEGDKTPIMEVSSTEVREKIHGNDNILRLLDEKVFDYINKNRLYRGY
jgi:nicotinate-nucleotide adenylyltransferase